MKLVHILVLTILAINITCDFISEVVTKYKNEVKTWEMVNPSESVFKSWTKEEIQNILGTRLLPSLNSKLNEAFDLMAQSQEKKQLKDLPTDFDSRNQWPKCIHPIRDQGHCGSCWAHGVSEALSDRFCIASNNQINVVLSPQDLVSCNKFVDFGCNGGIPLMAYTYTALSGLVTEDCFPYTSGHTEVNGPCLIKEDKCTDKSIPYKKYHSQLMSIRSHSNIEAIKTDIYNNGPVTAAFEVYSDFMSYSSGIYVRHSNEYLGGHAIKGIGWGYDPTTKLNYWIMSNSWGPNWGENGFFRIKMGECGIDSAVTRAEPKI